MRLDKYLIENGFFPSREKAQTAIKHNTVKVNGNIVTKASMEITENMQVEVIDLFNKYVSMGGLKLEKAVEDFELDFAGKTVLDIGSSTGGFTDCALQYGAAHVTAVDVGTDQLAEKLRMDPRVCSIENKDFRELTPTETPYPTYDLIVSDVSFISLTYILPYCLQFLKPDGKMMLLIKPQFEAGPSFLGHSGIVTDEKGYKVAIQKVVGEALNQHFYLNNLSISTLFEIHKNVEFLALFSTHDNRYRLDLNKICEEVKAKKKELRK
ncbi:MAG: TlyA family RNA methyltransferase [Bacteroidales bacterium]|nr:TlyA family RNA methyltransferase [Bacteroidales bacterium]